jgi:hypothetical protein
MRMLARGAGGRRERHLGCFQTSVRPIVPTTEFRHSGNDRMTKRLIRRPPGRPCAVCGSSDRLAIESAVGRGAPLRRIEKTCGVSARSIARHTQNCAPLATAKPVRPAAEPLLDGAGRVVVRANGHGGISPTPEPPPRDFTHPQRWWTPSAPGPRRGDKCITCGRKDDWWYIPGSHGGCSCWSPVFYGLRKLSWAR